MHKLMLFLWLATLLLEVEVYKHREKPQDDLLVFVNQDGMYHVQVKRENWFIGDEIYFHVQGNYYSTKDGSLILHSQRSDSGETDTLGEWTSVTLQYTAGSSAVEVTFKTYKQVPIVLFEQTFLDGAQNTSTGDVDGILSAFPNFKIDNGSLGLGYLAYGGIMVGDTGKQIGRWQSDKFKISSGRESGPIAFFNKQNDTVFMSPFNNFMAASGCHNENTSSYGWGIMGGVNEVPKSFSLKTMLYYDNRGISETIENWGRLMRGYYKKDMSYRESDMTINYLSYWTDNGAYYIQYYSKDNLIANITYEEAMLKTKEYADNTKLPYKSIQYSVWFQTGKGNGAALWEANPKLFPDGMKFMFEKTQLPATAHNRWWTPDTPYAKQNGGKYNFIVEEVYAIPDDQMFWNDFFKSSRQMGFSTLMQDWLNQQFGGMHATLSSVDLARRWLMQMGEGARQNGLTIQYCMSMSRHVLQSLEIPVVTQARASGDYSPGEEAQFQIGISSMLAHAVGLAPFKDTFWTTTTQPGNLYNRSEPLPELQAVVATLSTGPVGPGDMVGGTNRSLLMRCCRDDGLILRPSVPAFVINDLIKLNAFGERKASGREIWKTRSEISGVRFGIVFAAMINEDYHLFPNETGFGQDRKLQVYNKIQKPSNFSTVSPLVLGSTNCKEFCLYYISPVMIVGNHQVLLLGEMAKFVPLSPQRFHRINHNGSDMFINLRLSLNETVEFMYMCDGSLESVTCKWQGDEQMTIDIMGKTCVVTM